MRYLIVLVASLIVHVQSASIVTIADAIIRHPFDYAVKVLPLSIRSYATYKTKVDQEFLYTQNSSQLSKEEAKFHEKRFESYIQDEIKLFYSRSGFKPVGYDLDESAMVKMAIALSGGGHRAMLNSAGAIMAMDRRNSDYALAGILQMSRLICGLSGSTWALASLIANEFPQIPHLKDTQWKLETNPFKGSPAQEDKGFSLGWWLKLLLIRSLRRDFQTTIVDVWGLMLKDYFKPEPISMSLSDITEQSWFKKASFPYPIFVSTVRRPDIPLSEVLSDKFAMVEMSPYEFAICHEEIKESFPINYIGTRMEDGKSQEPHTVVKNFAQLSLAVGCSSNIFSVSLLIDEYLNWFQKNLIKPLLDKLLPHNTEFGLWPNPFYSQNTSLSLFKQEKLLKLADGGFNNQNIAIIPLMHKKRDIQVIVVSDSSSEDGNDLPSGKSLRESYDYAMNCKENCDLKQFPYIPDELEFLLEGLNHRPVFFGLDKDSQSRNAVLIAYLPMVLTDQLEKSPSTFKMTYTNEERDSVIANGAKAVSKGEKIGENFSYCMACLTQEPIRQAKNATLSDKCRQCFVSFAYNYEK